MAKHNRTITDHDRAAAKRAKSLWVEYQKKNRGVSQETAAGQLGYTQSGFSQYLNGKIALNLEATLKFAELFGVDPREIRNDLQALPPAGVVRHVRQPTPHYDALPEEALEVARAWLALPVNRRQCVKESLFFEAAVSALYPWLKVGKPTTQNYREFERQLARGVKRHETDRAKQPARTAS